MSLPTEPPLTSYPPAPWHASGQIWCALLTSRSPLKSPLTTCLIPHTLAALLIRYQEGALRYDEFALVSVQRRGHRIGLWTHCIWVDSATALWGGRQIWGIPKQMAHFTWTNNTVAVSDADGPLAELSFTPRVSVHTPFVVRFNAFGQRDRALLLASSQASGRLRPGRATITQWVDRLPALAHTRQRLALIAESAKIAVHRPRHLGHVPTEPHSGV
ncbi:acetoacetate decarboxylase family protein [Streptomyces alanosinicus]|uniref:Uncharacterized protein n=1 Tax=Streptomyces alanosinicus TaxID=68171 RepID=A0A918YKI1_9ACTN|nr:acetoacetate decarboxylase family protein [Streptomyces alanosinicus]GHE06558.1 hypothetical protein GCM10010339_47570 [Streptomyces alanosinicus]